MSAHYQGRPPTRRRALVDASNRANEVHAPKRPGDKFNGGYTTSAPTQLPHNESIVPNGTVAVHHEPPSNNKRLSAVLAESRPHNTKRDSQISTTSTNASNTTRKRKTHIGHWELGKTIGRGGCSRVRLVRHSGTGQMGAAKIISKATAEKVRALSLANLIKSAEHDPSLHTGPNTIPFGLEREICIMKLLDHPHIVRLYDIWESRNELYLIMEYVDGGELFSYIHEQGGLIEIHVVHIFRQIIAALIYCHRINIHHRDLKPENILLDRDSMTVKLVDFGMAALQPIGKKLTTPCGSPHYAAPEVIKTMSYDGAKADVWSCGVILYVLLTGTPPFNYSGEERHLKNLFQDIAAAKYVIPDGVSREAQDLIRKILVADPKKRVGLDEIWNHPFLRKYQNELKFVGEGATREYWTGPLPSIAEWRSLERTTIDPEILRWLRTLWHSEKEETLIHRLMSPEANQEKYFYSALLKYHADQLENYHPGFHHPVAHSNTRNSDHHHTKRHSPKPEDLELLPSKHKRSQSAFSILNDEHLRSPHSFYEAPESEASYDPYRSSKQPITPEQPAILHNITVHRGSSSTTSSNRYKRPATAMGHRTGSSLRVMAMRNNSKRSTTMSRGGSSNHSTPSHYSKSRSSLGSSHWQGSSPIVARPGGLGKRGVSFAHLRTRRGSGATVSTLDAEAYADYVSYKPRSSIGSRASSQKSNNIRSPARKLKVRGPNTVEVPRLKVRKPESPTKYIQGEARKVSMELGKAMEEAFNRSSISSSIRTTGTGYEIREDAASQYDTPPTSLSNRDSGGSTLATPSKDMFHQRPLPPIPTETPNTFVHRRLAETRAEIARRLAEEGESDEHIHGVLETLDRLLIPGAGASKRTVSAPAKSPEHTTLLQAIPEEGKGDATDAFDTSIRQPRVVTDPVRPHDRRPINEHQTIRLVSESPTRIAPLNIRKRSGASVVQPKPVPESTNVAWPGPAEKGPVHTYKSVQDDLFAARVQENAHAIEKSVTVVQTNVVKKKKSFWVRRNRDEKEPVQEKQIKQEPNHGGMSNIPHTWQALDDRIKNKPADVKPLTKHHQRQSDTSEGSEFPMRANNPVLEGAEGTLRKGFFSLFGKKTKDEKKKELDLGENFSTSSILSGYNLGPEHSSGDGGPRHGGPEVQMNWLSRFLHIKPVSKTLCFQISRGKVRQDLVRLLREWQRFGVRDVVFDRESNVINARIDKMNHLKMKPVSFIIELFVVLEHGRRVNLCIARFTQTRGAASSFRKAVDIIEDVCRAKNLLVEEEEKVQAMLDTLG